MGSSPSSIMWLSSSFSEGNGNGLSHCEPSDVRGAEDSHWLFSEFSGSGDSDRLFLNFVTDFDWSSFWLEMDSG